MKKLLLLLILIVIVLLGCSKEQKYYLTGNVKLSDSSNLKNIEIRLFNFTYREKKDDMIGMTKTDEHGNFKIEIPQKNIKYKLHVSYPNYQSYITEFFLFDDNPSLNVVLYPAAISKNVKSVSLVGDFNDFNWNQAVKMKKIGDNTYQTTVKYNKPEMKYQFLFDTEQHSFSDRAKNVRYEYDFGGDYYSIAQAKDSVFTITVNLNDYPKYEDLKSKQQSTGSFENAPNWTHFKQIKDKINDNRLSNANKIIIYASMGDATMKLVFPGLSDKQIKETVEKAKKVVDNAKKTVDSLLIKETFPPAKDYLIAKKINILLMNPENADFNDLWTLFKKINNLSYTDDEGSYYQLFYMPKFKEKEDEYIENIKDKIIASYSGNKRDESLFGFYRNLADYDKRLHDRKKYSKEILSQIDKLNLDKTVYKGEALSLKNQLKLFSSEFAPTFIFTDLAGKTHNLQDYRGKWVFLDFWSTWCQPCEIQIPNLIKLRKSISKDKLVMIGIAMEFDKDKVKKYVKEKKEDWIFTLDSPGSEKSIETLYGVSGIPAYFLIDDKGKLVAEINQGPGMYKEVLGYMNKGKESK